MRPDRRLGPVGRWAVSLVALTGLLVWLDPASIAAEIRRLDSRWLLLALLVNVNQMVISAWRWRLTAHRLGLSLPWRRALADYYLASFANQVLPGGVLGDAWRAQRHGSQSHHQGAAWRAVIIERGSGQLTVVVLALAVLGLSPAWRPALAGLWPAAAIFAGLIGLALVIVLVLTFQNSSNLASAYGIAVTGAVTIDTLLMAVLLVGVWKWRWWYAAP
ncbi:MAG: lysylphosphatidylglycerol synthase domain-containing protein, partial [Wenzhouxiangella sp.]